MPDSKLLDLVLVVAPSLAKRLMELKEEKELKDSQVLTVIAAASYELQLKSLEVLNKHVEETSNAIRETRVDLAIIKAQTQRP